MTTRAKGMALLLLLVIWAGLGAWLLMNTNEPQRVPLKFISGQSGAEGTRGQGNAAKRIDLALLMAQRQKADNSFMAPKNVFRPLKMEREISAPAPPPKKREIPRQELSPAVPGYSARSRVSNRFSNASPGSDGHPARHSGRSTHSGCSARAQPEELARQAGRQELSQYRYLGYLTRAGMDEAFLSRGKDLHIVKAGETINQRVLVKAITPTGVTLQETASQVEHTVKPLP